MHRCLPALARRAFLFALCLTWLFPAAVLADCAEVDPLELLPADWSPTWTVQGEPQTAYTVTELTVIINGYAFLFDQYGFVAAAFQEYAGEVAGEPAELTVSLYNQGSAANAAALYLDPESGQGEPLPDWTGSGEARVQISFGYVTLHFHEACFFASVVVNEGGEAALPEARLAAEAIVQAITTATPTARASWGTLKGRYR